VVSAIAAALVGAQHVVSLRPSPWAASAAVAGSRASPRAHEGKTQGLGEAFRSIYGTGAGRDLVPEQGARDLSRLLVLTTTKAAAVRRRWDHESTASPTGARPRWGPRRHRRCRVRRPPIHAVARDLDKIRRESEHPSPCAAQPVRVLPLLPAWWWCSGSSFAPTWAAAARSAPPGSAKRRAKRRTGRWSSSGHPARF
jgi:hypothetical protein